MLSLLNLLPPQYKLFMIFTLADELLLLEWLRHFDPLYNSQQRRKTTGCLSKGSVSFAPGISSAERVTSSTFLSTSLEDGRYAISFAKCSSSLLNANFLQKWSTFQFQNKFLGVHYLFYVWTVVTKLAYMVSPSTSGTSKHCYYLFLHWIQYILAGIHSIQSWHHG